MIVPLVGIIDLQDTGKETEAIRQCLEYFGFQTITYLIGRPDDFVQIISGRNRLSLLNTLIISGHGADGQIIMPKLDHSVYYEDEIRCDFGKEEVINHAHFRKELIISTACTTGGKAFGAAMVQKGASAYIAPRDYVEGNASLAFITRFFYELYKKRTVEKGFDLARNVDEQTKLFEYVH